MGAIRVGQFRKLNRVAAVTGGLLISMMLVAPASASVSVVDPGAGFFQLDGNIFGPNPPTTLTGATNSTVDWQTLFNVGSGGNVSVNASNGTTVPLNLVSNSAGTAHILSASFVPDYSEQDVSYFSSNKDIDPIDTGTTNEWGCTNQSEPLAKDEVLNAYGAFYQVPVTTPATTSRDGHFIIYLGQERESNNGNAFAGFWLNQNAPTCTPSPSGTGKFVSKHKNGDLLVLANFSNGGTVPNITILSWSAGTSSNSSTSNLTQIFSSTTVNSLGQPDTTCGALTTTSPACGITNGASITPPWNDASAGGIAALGAGQFFEAAIDLTQLLTTVPCFSQLFAESRSSQSLTADLKDYASASFSTCNPPTVTTSVTPAASSGRTPAIALNGGVSSDSANVSNLAGTPTGTMTFNLYGPYAAPPTCSTSSSPVGQISDSAIYSSHTSSFTTNTDGTVTYASGSTTAAVGGTSGIGAVGTYYWQAVYSGDTGGGRNLAAASDCASEPLLVTNAGIATTPTPSGTLDLNGLTGPMMDSATVGSVANPGYYPGDATGTGLGKVSFKLYGPFTKATGNTCASDIVAAESTVSATPVPSQASASYATAYSSGGGFTPVTPGWYDWIASYAGNATNAAVAGLCNDATEQFRVVDANIQITPLTATNTIGNDHVLTATVNVNDGSGYVSAPDNTSISFSLLTGSVGTFKNNVSTCSTVAGSCTVTIQSAVAGTSTVRATVTTSLGGLSVSRHTGDGWTIDSVDAVKTWVSPTTQLTVYDQLTGLGSAATGTVTYRAYPNLTTCSADSTFVAGAQEGSTTTISAGTADKSTAITIGPGTTWGTTIYWRAMYVGDEGTFISGCTESAVSS